MIIWKAGAGHTIDEKIPTHLRRNRLLSYFYTKHFNKKQMKFYGDQGLFIDSGAFTAWSKGKTIIIDDYISFINKYEKHIQIYANLDDIKNPEVSLQNQKIMEKAGLSPLPCFHYGENIKYLKKYLNDYPYIALGGMVTDTKKKGLIQWLNDIFANYVCDKNGISKIKIHGFGIGSLDLMRRYPWYSVDSSTWLLHGRMRGGISIPLERKGGLVEWKIHVSSSDKKKDILDGTDYLDSLSPTKRWLLSDYLKKIGRDENKMRTQCHERDSINMIYIKKVQEVINKSPTPFKLKVAGLLLLK